MFTLMSGLQTFFNKCRWDWGVSHKIVDPIVQRLPFAKYLACFIVALMLFTLPAFAGLGDLDLETQRVLSGNASSNGESRTVGATFILPVDLINGGVAARWLHNTSTDTDTDADTVNNDFQYRVQAGPILFKDVSLQFYVDGDWGVHRDSGSFIRPGILNFEGWRVSGGVGTYLRGLQEELRREPDDPETLIKPIAFVSLNRAVGEGTLSVLATWSPTFDFEVHDLFVEPQFTVDVGGVSLSLIGKFGEQHEERVHEYIGQVNYPF